MQKIESQGNKLKKVEVFNTTELKRLPNKPIKDLIKNAAIGENVEEFSVKVIFVDNEEILRLNKEFLNHDYYTDVITFNLEENTIDGEIYICTDVAQSQADEYKVSLKNELMRLAVHGFLHLVGYDDSTDEEKSKMKSLEDKYLSLT